MSNSISPTGINNFEPQSVGVADAVPKGIQSSQLMPIAMSMLSLDERTTVEQARETWKGRIGSMCSQERGDIVSYLKEMAEDPADNIVNDFVREKLPAVENEAKQGVSIDRLMELLFGLLLLLGRVNTERNANAAKFAEISVKLAGAAGDRTIEAANSNFAGALTGMVAGVGIASGGFYTFNKGTQGQIANIKNNGRDITKLTQANERVGSALNRQGAPLNGATPQEKLGHLKTSDGDIKIQPNSSHLFPAEQQTLGQPSLDTKIVIDAKDSIRRQSDLENANTQVGGQAIMQSGVYASPILQQGYATQAASQTAQGKIYDAEGAVASTVQHSDEQSTQRSTELLAKIFSLIVSATDEANRNLGDMSRAIKA